MTCLRCGSPLDLVVAIDERGVPTGPGHNYIYDWSRVLSCPSCEHGDLRHFSHDCWPSEDEIDMEWSTQVSPAGLAVLEEGLALCPDAAVPTCECAVHASLRESEKGMKRLRLYPRHEEGERPVVSVALRDDGVPEFIYTPTA